MALPPSPPRIPGEGALVGCPGGAEDDPRGEHRVRDALAAKAAAVPKGKAKGKAKAKTIIGPIGPIEPIGPIGPGPAPPPVEPLDPALPPVGGGDSDSDEILIAASSSKAPPPVKAKAVAKAALRFKRSDRFIPAIGGLTSGQALFDDYAPFGNWRFKCPQACACERTLGLGPRNTKHGVLEPLAFLHVWALTPAHPTRGHVKTAPDPAVVRKFLDDHRDELQVMYDHFPHPAAPPPE